MSEDHDRAAPEVRQRRGGVRSAAPWVLAGLVVVAAIFGVGPLGGDRSVRASISPGAADIGFCQDMSVHHAQAVLMAQEAVDRSRTPAIRLLARQILATQAQERGTITGWLTLWNAPQLPSGPPMTWMTTPASSMDARERTPSARMASTMPGLATQADLDHLAAATGKGFDILFLQLMVRHHAGGITMATRAHRSAKLPLVRALAGAMAIDQAQENAQMNQLLKTDGATPLPLS